MCKALRSFLAVLFGVSLCLAGSLIVFGAGSPAQTVNLPAPEFQKVDDDDDEDDPDVTDRVARISFLRGESRIRRLGADEWEKATLNLPVVEGDEISTDGDGWIEIQFDKNQHLRLAENSYLKIMSLKDAGIAVSLSLGTMSLRITAFDKDKAFFEIDAPKTTMAIQLAGSYRVDAGKQGDSEVRVSATEGGEARVYSDTAGFTLKNGRSTRIFIEGPTAGEWETADASKFADDFGTWSAERDVVIAKRLKDAYYDKFYDNDIYGAEDLNGYGDWVYTKDYGYVWRPYRTSISVYPDWSPYRYGHWRWMPPYGWIWVNDEPWGWATYHHGRWFYDDGYWNWSPYGYYRHRRSWWWGAHVVINIFNNNVCWYPSPYHHRRYNYNADYTKRRIGDGVRVPRQPVGGSTAKVSTRKGPKVDVVPPIGVVAVDTKDFGTRGRARTASPILAKTVFSRSDDDGKNITLPRYSERRPDLGTEIIAEKPRGDLAAARSRIGAEPRKSDAPMDNELRTKRVFGGRSPQPVIDPNAAAPDDRSNQPRKTGVVDRPPVAKHPNPEILLVPPGGREKITTDESEVPRHTPVTPKESPRYERPAEREKPSYTPPQPKETPRSEPRERPKSDSPPPKSETKTESKPAPPPTRKDKPDSLR